MSAFSLTAILKTSSIVFDLLGALKISFQVLVKHGGALVWLFGLGFIEFVVTISLLANLAKLPVLPGIPLVAYRGSPEYWLGFGEKLDTRADVVQCISISMLWDTAV